MNSIRVSALAATAVLAIAIAAGVRMPAPREALPARGGPALTEARSWGYQLQGPRADRLADAIDVLVIDYSRDGSAAKVFTRAEVDAFRRRADGRGRIMLAYLSIGEAETYRYYWNPDWRRSPPSWLGAENKEWRGNFQVRYWAPEWQRIIVAPGRTQLDRVREYFEPARVPYIDRILEAGFDGVYLDRIDAYAELGRGRASAAADMIGFVAAIGAYARARKPGFLVVAQNGEELLLRADWRRGLDGVAKEDLLFGIDGEEQPNGDGAITRSQRLLGRAKADGLPVFVVEYISDNALRRQAQARIGELGFIALFATRGLDAPPAVLKPQIEPVAASSATTPPPAR